MAFLTLDAAQKNVGRIARSVESGWKGKIMAAEMQGDQVMYRMQGIDFLAQVIDGQSDEQALCDDDTQWFTPEDVVLLKSK